MTFVPDSGTPSGAQFAAAQVNATAPGPFAECDALWRSGPRATTMQTLPVPPPTPGSPDLPKLASNPKAARVVISGYGGNNAPHSDGNIPRTFDNIANATAALLYDLGQRNAQFIQPSISANSISFLASNFAIYIRREVGSTRAAVPPITDAELICASPGYIPKRTVGTVDLTSIGSLPDLKPISALGFGFDVNVKSASGVHNSPNVRGANGRNPFQFKGGRNNGR